MTQNKHTPGPWHRNIPPARKYPTVWAGRNTHVAAVVAGAPRGSGSGETMTDGELEANINLIAAAPELLAEAIELLRNAEYADGVATVLTQDCEALQAAIAKAEGGAS